MSPFAYSASGLDINLGNDVKVKVILENKLD